MTPIPAPPAGSGLLSNRDLPQIPESTRAAMIADPFSKGFVQWIERFHECGIDGMAIDGLVAVADHAAQARHILGCLKTHREAEWVLLRLTKVAYMKIGAYLRTQAAS